MLTGPTVLTGLAKQTYKISEGPRNQCTITHPSRGWGHSHDLVHASTGLDGNIFQDYAFNIPSQRLRTHCKGPKSHLQGAKTRPKRSPPAGGKGLRTITMDLLLREAKGRARKFGSLLLLREAKG